MNSLEYRNKRDKTGLLLKNSAYSLCYDFVDECMEILSKSEVYEDLVLSFNNQYIEFYFRKLIFYEFLPIAHQLTIKQWDDKNDLNNGVVTIDSSSFKCSELLETIPLIKNYNVIFNSDGSFTFLQSIKKKYKPSVKKALVSFNNLFSNFYINNQNNYLLGSTNSSRIGVFLTEGLDLNKRSNIFWLPDSNIDHSSVLIYFSLGKKASKSIILKLKEHNLQWVNLRSWKSENKFQIGQSILDSIKNNKKTHTKTHKWLLSEIGILINDINYWYSFFQQFNIRVHSDNTEYGVEIIAKQIALHELNGISFTPQRSFLDCQKGKTYSYYPSDLYFAWGNNTVQKFKEKILNKNNPSVESIVISGCQNIGKTFGNRLSQLEDIKSELSKNGAKTVILFLDSNHSSNQTWVRQNFGTKTLIQLYVSLLKMVIDNEEIALIIKPKKIAFFNSLANTIEKYLEDANKTGRLYVENNPVGEKTSLYASISDLVIGVTSEDLPASVIECAILKKPAIIYDYASLSSVEKSFYSWAYQNVIFDKLDIMIENIQLFSKNGNKYNDFGDWFKYLDDFDPFLDQLAYSRIGFYISMLLKLINSGFEKNVVIRMANEAYSKKYGKDKIVLLGNLI
jgi:hypothetical protein